MSDPILQVKRLLQSSCFLLLLMAFNAFAQTSKVVELEKKLAQKQPDTLRLNLLQQLCTAYTSVDPVKKFVYAKQYLELAQKLDKKPAIADAYIHMGISYGIRNKLDSAISAFKTARALAVKAGDWLGTGRAIANLGYLYDRMDNYRESIKCYLDALSIYKKYHYQKGINLCSTNIGAIYSSLKQYQLAETYFKQCYDSYRAAKDETGMANALMALGNCKTALGNYDEALAMINQSLAIRKKTGETNGIALSLRSLGDLYNEQKLYAKAIEPLTKANALLQQMNDKFEQKVVLYDLARASLGMKDYKSAEAYALQGLAMSRSIKSGIGIASSLQQLVEIYNAKKDVQNAFKYQTEYVKTQDSVLAQQALKDVTLTEFGRIRTENAQLSTENTTNKARVSHYSNIIIIITVVLIAVVALLLLQYRRNIEKQIANKLLRQQKEEINAINRDLAGLNEEVITQMELTAAQNAELEHLNDVKNKFFSIVSHDLRGPIGSLQSLFRVYRDGNLGEEELAALLPQLEDTIISTGAFLDNLLEWSKSQLEGIRINAIDFNVMLFIDENIHLWESRIKMKGLKVTKTGNERVMAHADPNMINLVLRNLLSNSVKFCNPGDEITLTAETKNGKTLICVRDNGPGITQKDQQKLFSLEHTISSGSQGEKGNHLGLILCREMVIQNQGKLWFESDEGKGTTFWVELPAGHGNTSFVI